MPVVQDIQLATIADLQRLAIARDALRDLTPDEKNAALLAASAEVMEALRAQFVMPLVSWGTGVRKVVCDIAAWIALANRGFSAEGGDSNIRIAAEDARARIKLWASDKGAVPDVIDSGAGIEARPTALPRITTSLSRGWSVSGLDPSRYSGVTATNRPPFTGG